jgi:hypothetical protein
MTTRRAPGMLAGYPGVALGGAARLAPSSPTPLDVADTTYLA